MASRIGSRITESVLVKVVVDTGFHVGKLALPVVIDSPAWTAAAAYAQGRGGELQDPFSGSIVIPIVFKLAADAANFCQNDKEVFETLVILFLKEKDIAFLSIRWEEPCDGYAQASSSTDPSTDPLREQLNELLRTGLNRADVEVFDAQYEVNRALCDQKSVLNVIGTSKGKTETYLLFAKLARQIPGNGPVMVLVPASALLNDQLERAIAFGFNAVALRSLQASDKAAQGKIISELGRTNNIDIIFMTLNMLNYHLLGPGKLFDPLSQFKKEGTIAPSAKWQRVPLVVVDEVHSATIVSSSKATQCWYTAWKKLQEYPWYNNSLKLGLTATLDRAQKKALAKFVPGSAEWTEVPS